MKKVMAFRILLKRQKKGNSKEIRGFKKVV